MSSPAEARSSTPVWIATGSIALSALLAARLAFEDASYLVPALAFALVALIGALWYRARAPGPYLALATFNLIFAVPELGLRSADFRYVSGLQFGYPDASEFWELEFDEELFWKLPHVEGLTNSWGFFGPEPALPKPAGSVRVLVLGDSCSQQGYPHAWPELALAELARTTGARIDEVNLALSGYSSHQGRVLAERHAAELAPDLALVLFGWNDHWRARGATDARKRVDLRFERVYRRVRLLQAVRSVLDGLGWRAPEGTPIADNRVPLEAYRENLTRIVEACRTSGAAVVLITAPTTHDLAVPPYLIERHFVADARQAVAEHRAYGEVVREVARASGAELLDLERELAQGPGREQLFLSDGIHFSELGRAEVARRVAEFARRLPLFQ